jgi:hypothetical protein
MILVNLIVRRFRFFGRSQLPAHPCRLRPSCWCRGEHTSCHGMVCVCVCMLCKGEHLVTWNGACICLHVAYFFICACVCLCGEGPHRFCARLCTHSRALNWYTLMPGVCIPVHSFCALMLVHSRQVHLCALIPGAFLNALVSYILMHPFSYAHAILCALACTHCLPSFCLHAGCVFLTALILSLTFNSTYSSLRTHATCKVLRTFSCALTCTGAQHVRGAGKR